MSRRKRPAAKVAVDDSPSSPPSTQDKRARAAPARDRPPRPANAWICYRSAKVHELKTSKTFAKLPQADVSELIGQLWREEAPNVRRHYELEAARRKKEHKEAYPDYVYRPVRREKSERPGRKKTEESVSQPAPPSTRMLDFPSVLQPLSPPESTVQSPAADVLHFTLPQPSQPSLLPFYPELPHANFDLAPAPQPPNPFASLLPTPPAEYRSDPFQPAFPLLTPFTTVAPVDLEPAIPYARFERTYLTPPLSASSVSSDFGADHATLSESYLDVSFASIDPSLLAALESPL
ncbi:Pcc1 protein [Rhodotorula toruloides ATCC 204091]|uniref:Pcc1 protein n=1 Tax=Rhodotorula toruloides TaxID=5286 RepID=A0A0K3CKE8_RHOTO|nr:Pcc1 protein [Rhodotorula toruloides ATCC 204091]KAK4332465.1 Pcc1 protein [Rhodotorula toruloides]PRQ72773.1 Pcc1 protein [Rhodotorula toruloides]